ncbi:MAG: right-handed parallel beta-helix repeat-containing protein [Chitinophagales bacterium]
MKHLLALLLLSAKLITVHATNYYFSSSSGDDSRTSTQAQNSATPWKTLTKLNSIMSTLKAGDFVYFKRGDSFYGNITITKSGSAGSPVTFSAYGTGAKPIITGFTTITSWTNLGSNIWESTSAISSLISCNMVVVNNIFAPIGRWPNTGYRTISSHVTNTSITDKSLTSSPNWTGGEVVIRKEHWIIDRNLITNHTGSTITYTSGSTYSARDGFGYFIQNHKSTLDLPNEWYYNSSTKKLGIYSTTAPSKVQATTADVLVSIGNTTTGYAYVTLDNLSLQGANSNAVQIQRSNHVTIQNCDIAFAGMDGINGTIYSGNSSYCIIQNCTVNYSNSSGIHLFEDFSNAAITNNIIQNSGTIPGMGVNGDNTYQGVQVKAASCTFSYNQVINAGYCGFSFIGNSSKATNNLINGFCMVKDDGAGIYTNNSNYTGRQVLNNIVINGIGNTDGTGTNISVQTEGIYIDDGTTGVTISGNTVANIPNRGIYIHNAHEITIQNNTVFNCNLGELGFLHDNISPNDPIRNVSMTGNKFVSKTSSQNTFVFTTSSNDMKSFGTADNNYYARPVSDNSTILTQPTGTSVTYISLAQWQSTTSQDIHSKKSPKAITTATAIRFEYNATTTSKIVSLGASYMDMAGTVYNGSITLAPYTSAVLVTVSGSTTKTVANTEELLDGTQMSIDKASLRIYPDPVEDNFTVDLNNSHTGTMSIQIINQAGAVRHSFIFIKDQQINHLTLPSKDLSAGVYFVRIQIGAWSETRKIVKL